MKDLWKKAAYFFERGDLVPFAVVVSVWHFVKTLLLFGEWGPVAIAQGIFVDLLHFRTVRRAVESRTKSAVFVAILTTAMSFSFHLLFYIVAVDASGAITYTWTYTAVLLALPLPLGIPILAWQTTVNEKDQAADVDAVLARVDSLQAQNDKLLAELDAALAESAKLRKDRDKALARLDSKAVDLDKLPERLATYTRMVASGMTPNGDFSSKYGVGLSTLDRTNNMLLKD